MKILVGILYCIEKEFEECIESISKQTYKGVDFFVIEGMPNKIAHDQLYKRFMTNAYNYDLFIKIDADMVLVDTEFFRNVVDKFQKNSVLEHIEIAVHDFFSDQLIWGLHIYRNTVKWEQSKEDLFTDLVPMKRHKKISDDNCLAPAAIHCKNPGRFQSFHYGIHKAVKIMQPGRKQKKREHAIYHWNNLQKTWKHYLRTNDIRLGFAILGAELAFKNKMIPPHLDYSNPCCRDLFQKYKDSDNSRIKKNILWLRIVNWGILPPVYRFKVLQYLEGGHIL